MEQPTQGPRRPEHHLEEEPIGFVGLGVMGRPMALNLVLAGLPVLVWTRTTAKTEPLRAAGAEVAAEVDEVFERARTVILMLADADAVDTVLDRSGPAFSRRVAGRVIVPMGTTSPTWSEQLGASIRAAGGRHVEAPVSGSRVPAENGRLVAMVAGDRSAVPSVMSLIAPLCAQVVDCGLAPQALTTKLAVNLFLITMVAGLAESYHFAVQHGIDLEAFRAVLDAGPMASEVSRIKLAKLAQRDFAVQAAIADVHYNSRLVSEEARRHRVAAPLLDVARGLFGETEDLGLGRADMAAVVAALERRTAGLGSAPAAPRPAAPTSKGPPPDGERA
ncbi:MAG TPA: NAD(P)-dependent oxidoreductase [Microlunatus sp.]|nr:NAD(P)-dependent oxidoreductase [Microlunatus sp.]